MLRRRIAHKLLFAMCTALVAACFGDNGPVHMTELERYARVSELQPNVVSMDVPRQEWRIESAKFGRPFGIRVLGESLAVVMDRAEPFLHLVNIERGEYLYPLTSSGDDDAEPINVYRLAVSPSTDKEFLVYDAIGSTLSAFRLTDNPEKPLTVLNTTRISAVEVVDAPVWHNDGSISVEPLREKTLRARIGPDGSLTDHSGVDLTASASAWVPKAVWREAMEGQTCPSPDRKKLARSFQFTAQLLVLDSAGNVVPGSNDQRFYPPQFNVRDPTGEVSFASTSGDVRPAYRSCGTTKSFIFGLFSGRQTRLGERNSEIHSFQIHVFDWKARMVGGFRLARETIHMDVNPQGSLILALEGGTRTPAVVAYSVPRKFRSR